MEVERAVKCLGRVVRPSKVIGARRLSDGFRPLQIARYHSENSVTCPFSARVFEQALYCGFGRTKFHFVSAIVTFPENRGEGHPGEYDQDVSLRGQFATIELRREWREPSFVPKPFIFLPVVVISLLVQT